MKIVLTALGDEKPDQATIDDMVTRCLADIDKERIKYIDYMDKVVMTVNDKHKRAIRQILIEDMPQYPDYFEVTPVKMHNNLIGWHLDPVNT